MVFKENDPRVIGRFNETLAADASVPVFFLSGRLDPMQKGFDVVFNVFEKRAAGRSLLFFTPTLHHGSDELSFFRDIALRSEGRIVIWPFRIPLRRYRTLLQGSSFLLMPSLYEPFGAASEGMLNGTPVVARATGGLLSQVQPGAAWPLPQQYGTIFPPSATEIRNGILFKESFPDEEAKSMWRTLLELPMERRMENALYRSIVDAAGGALHEAINVFTDGQVYGAMVANGFTAVQRCTWVEAVRKYSAVYDAAVSRGS
jgi:glycogen synthase